MDFATRLRATHTELVHNDTKYADLGALELITPSCRTSSELASSTELNEKVVNRPYVWGRNNCPWRTSSRAATKRAWCLAWSNCRSRASRFLSPPTCSGFYQRCALRARS